MPERKLLEERRSSAVEKRPSQTFAPPGDIDQPTLVQGLEDRASTYSSDLLDLRPADGLPIRDDSERLERRRRKPLRASGQLRPLDRFSVLGSRQYLPSTGDLDQLDAVLKRRPAMVYCDFEDLRRYGEAVVRSDGTFALTNLAPGKYWLIAKPVAADDVNERTPRPLAWDAAARAALRKAAAAGQQTVELGSCMRISEYKLTAGN